MHFGNEQKKRITRILCWIVPLSTFAVTLLFVNKYFTYSVSSDEASELILGRLLASENAILSKNWYYSTELRVLNTNLLYGFFFKLTGNWHLVRMLSYAVMYTLLLAAVFFLGKTTKNITHQLLFGSLLFLPLSGEYYYLYLYGAYYLPYLIISLMTVAMSEWFIASKKRWGQVLSLLLAGLLALFSSMGGARQIIVLYLPMIIASAVMCLDRNKPARWKWLIFSSVVFLAAIIGYEINIKILSKQYSFQVWDNIKFTYPTTAKLEAILKGFLRQFGFSEGSVFSVSLFKNFVCVLWLGLTLTAIIYAIKNRRTVELSYSFFLSDDAKNFETVVINNSSNEIRIESIIITRTGEV